MSTVETTCGCGKPMQRIGEDVAEKLDYEPGVFTVERHIRGKWVCKRCEKITQAPVAPHVIDKGLPTTSLLAQVLLAKYLDHLPLYRQAAIFERAGHLIARSTLAQWVGECGVHLQPLVDAFAAELLRQPVLHADETPVAMLKPGHGKTHRAYLWSYCTTPFNPTKAVVFDFAESRGGQHVCGSDREALSNAVRHASARRVEVQIVHCPDQLLLRILDDGVGMAMRDPGGRAGSGYWGLEGMRERAVCVGGRLNIWSAPGAGTEIELIVPSTSEYHHASAKFR